MAESQCQITASNAVMSVAKESSAVWQVENTYCASASNRQVIICQVLGSFGDGSGDREYRAIVSKDCKKVYRIDLIGEE